MPKNSSIEGTKHPYLRVKKWESGELCFWMNNPHYSTKEQDRLTRETAEWCKRNSRSKIVAR